MGIPNLESQKLIVSNLRMAEGVATYLSQAHQDLVLNSKKKKKIKESLVGLNQGSPAFYSSALPI